MKILVIEDDKETAEYISRGFKQRGHVADIAKDGHEGLFLARDGNYDVIVLDPPKLAPSRSHAAAAEKAYKDLNLHGLHLSRLPSSRRLGRQQNRIEQCFAPFYGQFGHHQAFARESRTGRR